MIADPRLQQYVCEVMKFRKALNLTSIADESVFCRRFIEPTISMASKIPDHGRLLDVGSGMGVPGIPLLVCKPGIVGVLVERRKKRAEFLRHVVRKLGLSAEVYDADIDHLPSLGVDVCVARAVSSENTLLSMCAPHCNANALAVLPVPRDSQPVHVDGWELVDVCHAAISGSEDETQLVRCYRYGG